MLKVVFYLVCRKDRVREEGEEEKEKKLANLQDICPPTVEIILLVLYQILDSILRVQDRAENLRVTL
jgi:hypothetical protein